MAQLQYNTLPTELWSLCSMFMKLRLRVYKGNSYRNIDGWLSDSRNEFIDIVFLESFET